MYGFTQRFVIGAKIAVLRVLQMSSDFVQAFLKKTYFECGNKLCYKILLNQKGC